MFSMLVWHLNMKPRSSITYSRCASHFLHCCARQDQRAVTTPTCSLRCGKKLIWRVSGRITFSHFQVLSLRFLFPCDRRFSWCWQTDACPTAAAFDARGLHYSAVATSNKLGTHSHKKINISVPIQYRFQLTILNQIYWRYI